MKFINNEKLFSGFYLNWSNHLKYQSCELNQIKIYVPAVKEWFNDIKLTGGDN